MQLFAHGYNAFVYLLLQLLGESMHDTLLLQLLPETKNDASLLLLLSIAYYYQYHRHLQYNADADKA